MNVAVLLTCTTSPLIEIALELAQVEINSGNRVTIVRCDGVFGACIANPSHETARCETCIRKQITGLSLLTGDYHTALFPKPRRERVTSPLRTLDSLLAYSEDGLGLKNIGKSIAALYTGTHFKDYDSDLSDKQDFIDRAYPVGWQVLEALESFKGSLDRVYIHNGRFPADRVAIQYCRQKNIEFFCYDTSDVKERYVSVPNNPIHDIATIKKNIEAYWNSAGPDRAEVGTSFFVRRRGHVNYGSHSFTAAQVANTLPPRLDRSRRIVSIFNSTAEEIFTVDGFEYPFYRDEHDALVQIFRSLAGDDDLQFVLRVHPHMRGCDNYQTRYLSALAKEFPTIVYVSPEDSVDSYELMAVSEKVIVLNSTMGIEAAYWGKPVVQIGRTYYEDLGCTHRPRNHQDLIAMIRDPSLAPLGNSNCLKYGYWDLTNGQLYVHSEAVSMGVVNFRSVDLNNLKEPAYRRAAAALRKLTEQIRTLLKATIKTIGKDQK